MEFVSLRLNVAVAAVSFFLAMPCASLAQTFRGGISGIVTDPSGAAVAGAAVKGTQTETNLTHETVTSSAGEFSLPDLPLGMWQVTVTQPGFEVVRVTQVNVEVGKVVTLPVKLQVAAQGQLVEVSATAVALDTDTSTLSAVIPHKAVQDIPLNGRNFTQLVNLVPGGANGSIDGARSNQNNWQIDGADNNDLWQNSAAVNQGGVAGVAGTLLPIDAIDQFSITSSGSAEYGRNGGSTINMVIKSGANSLHGTLYYFNRNDALAAQNPFATSKPKLKNNQFGTSIGGPIIKNKLFFFLTYERQKLIAGNATAATEPSGAYVAAAQSMLARYSIPVNPVSLNLLNFWPARGRTGPAGSNNFVSTDDSNDYSDNGIAKFDYNINSRNNLSARYFVGTGEQIAPSGSAFYDYYQVVPSRMNNFSIVDNQVFSPRAVNQVLLGVNIFLQTFADENTSFDPIAAGLNTGADPGIVGSPKITITGFDPIGPTAPLGRIDSTGHITDTFSYSLGKHQFRAGGEYRYSHNDVFYNTNKRGTFTFDGTQGPWASDATISDKNIKALADFMAGDVSTSSIVYGPLQRIYDEHGYEWFAQDSWKATPKLTVNYGVHWTAYGPFYSPKNDVSTFIPGQGVVYTGNGHNLYNWRWNDFAPRFGFAYSATPKVVIRGGYGIYYDVPNLNAVAGNTFGNGGAAGVQANPPSVYTLTRSSYQVVSGQPIFTTSNIPSPPYNLFSISQTLKTPSVQSFNLNTQYQASKGIVMQLGYVGSVGRHLLVTRDINQAALSTLGTKNTLTLAQPTRPYYSAYPQYGVIDQMQTQGISDYNSLQATVRTSEWHGLASQFSYTWAHALDNGSAARNTVPMDSLNASLDYGRSSFDIRHAFNGYIVYTLPKSTHGPSRLVNGWQLNALPAYRTGGAINITYGANVSGTFEGLDRVNVTSDPFAGVNQSIQNHLVTWFNKGVFAAPVAGTYGTLGRDVFSGPSFGGVDFSIVKNTPVTERISTQFRVEIFNIFNRTNYANPTTSFSSGSFGTISGTVNGTSAPGIGPGEPRNVQLALKVVF